MSFYLSSNTFYRAEEIMFFCSAGQLLYCSVNILQCTFKLKTLKRKEGKIHIDYMFLFQQTEFSSTPQPNFLKKLSASIFFPPPKDHLNAIQLINYSLVSLLLFYKKWFWEDPNKVHVAKSKGHFTVSILPETLVLDFSQATLWFPVNHKPWAFFFQSFMTVVINDLTS